MWKATRVLVLAVLAVALTVSGSDAELALDAVVQAGDFVFYRDAVDEHAYYYVPDEPRLATDARGRTQFSMIKYTRAGAETAPETRGGLVHFLVTWGFDEATLRRAESALRRVDDDGRIAGPVPFKEGRFAVVSASAGADGIFTRRLVGEGKAPILPGGKAAVSMALTPEGATVLWESFQQPTSEVSVVFGLTYSGLTPAYQARMRVNWNQVYTHHDVSLGVEANVGIVRAEAQVQAIFDELRRSGAIELEVMGESEDMEGILEVAYRHILRQMFEPTMLPPDAATTPSSRRSVPVAARAKQPLLHDPLWAGLGWSVASRLRRPRALSVAPDDEFLTPPFVEPYVPPPPADLADGMNAAAEAARADVRAERYDSARERFYALYYRGLTSREGAERLVRTGNTAWNVAEASKRVLDWPTAALFYQIAVGYYAGADAGGDDARAAREELRSALSHCRTQGISLPDAIDAFTRAPEPAAVRYSRSLGDIRTAYFAGDFDQAIRHADAAREQFGDLPEPHLWLGRAQDRQRRADDAADAYGQFLDRYEETLAGLRDNPGLRHVVRAVEARRDALVGQSAASEAGETAESPEDTASSEEAEAGGGNAEGGAGEAGGEGEQAGEAAGEGGAEAAEGESGAGAGEAEARGSETRRGGRTGRGDGAPAVGGGDNALINIEVGYVYRQIKQSGEYTVDLRQRLREDRELTVAGNIGGFIRGQADARRYLLEVNLDDPAFQDRTVEVILDGQDYEGMREYVNAVAVQLRRRHDDGSTSQGDIVFTAEQFAGQGNRQSWVYPRIGDAGEAWTQYEYKVTWQYYGGAETSTDWIRTDVSTVTLSSPATYRELRVSASQDDLLDHGVRAVAAQFRHRLFGRTVAREVLVDFMGGDPLNRSYRYLRQPGDETYEMRTIWTLRDGREVVQDWTPRQGSYVFLDFPE